ncbi:hypothetical protein [Proteiniborus sp.]|uniref:hypothetical protein n=1 Tax=Proteiniborus sp. TaxID=2079015 RepID=UPI00331EE4E2
MNNKLKHIVSMIIVLTICFSSIQVFAVNVTGNMSLKDNKDKTGEIAINISSGKAFHVRELTNESIKQDMLNKIMEYKKSTNSNVISPFYRPNPGDESTLLYGPYQKYSDNRLSKSIIKLACDAAILLVPGKILETELKTAYKVISAVIANHALIEYRSAVDDIPDDNWYEVWQWKYYSDYYDAYVIMTTIVFYADKYYSDPISVTYYETDIEFN